jgi:hypothetical protein
MVQEDQVGPLPLMNVRDARQGASK